MNRVPKGEIDRRTADFQLLLGERHLDGAFILQNVDIYYFSGTIQASVLFVPRVGEPVLMVRMVKSPHKVDQIRKAARILHKGYEGIRDILREGMTELEVDGHLSLIARREGHMGILRMRGWNQEMTCAHVLSGESGSVVSFLNSPHGGSGNTPDMAQGAGFRSGPLNRRPVLRGSFHPSQQNHCGGRAAAEGGSRMSL